MQIKYKPEKQEAKVMIMVAAATSDTCELLGELLSKEWKKVKDTKNPFHCCMSRPCRAMAVATTSVICLYLCWYFLPPYTRDGSFSPLNISVGVVVTIVAALSYLMIPLWLMRWFSNNPYKNPTLKTPGI